MLNRSTIMQDAWRRYRLLVRSGRFDRSTFAFYLGCAWDAAKAALMTPAQRRVDQLQVKLAMLPYKSFRVNIAARETAIKAKIAALAA